MCNTVNVFRDSKEDPEQDGRFGDASEHHCIISPFAVPSIFIWLGNREYWEMMLPGKGWESTSIEFMVATILRDFCFFFLLLQNGLFFANGEGLKNKDLAAPRIIFCVLVI